MNLNIPDSPHPRIVIIGAGFGGLALAKKLCNTDFQVVLIDKHNYHTFQPLLYQVATGGLEPDSIAYPIRKVFRKKKNVFFRMTEVKKINRAKNSIETKSGNLQYDYLVLAMGGNSNFYNFTPQQKQMMPLKSLSEALNLRSYVLQNFEKASATDDLELQDCLTNIVIVGGGPTGVELAGALGEMKKFIFPKDYPDLNMDQVRILLFQSAPRLLPSMSEEASEKALIFLKEFEVEVYLDCKVNTYQDNKIFTNKGHEIASETIIWTAGIKGNMLPGLPEKALGKGDRILVDSHNQVLGTEHIFAIGDLCAMVSEENPFGHPMVAPVAQQQGALLAQNLIAKQKGKEQIPFLYNNQGSMATIGRNRAVVDLPRIKFQGTFAWFIWMFVHIMSLVGFRNKLVTLWDWIYNYFTFDRAMRLIIRPFVREKVKPGQKA